MNDYRNEVIESISVELGKKVDEAERIFNEAAAKQNTERIDLSESTDDVVDNAITPDNVSQKKTKRFTWLYALVKQNTKTFHPFLNNNNLQDLYFSEKVLEVAPYRAKHGESQKRYNFIIRDLVQKVHSDGTRPLQNLSDFSAKGRFSAYLRLSEQWIDKTGAVFDDGTSPDDSTWGKGYKNMTVREKIAFNVDNILDDVASLESAANQKKLTR